MSSLMTRDEALSMPLSQRELVLRQRGLKPVDPSYCIVWEDPHDPDAPAKITVPSPLWMAMALHGNVLPPVEVYPLPTNEQGEVMAGHGLHTGVTDAMSEEDAMEYLVRKDIPKRVWNTNSNRPRFRICKRAMIPADRRHRNAWQLAA